MLTPRDYDYNMARPNVGEVVVTILGTAQDGGFPQPGCQRECCTSNIAQTQPRYPVSLGIKGRDGSHHMFEASRMMHAQFQVWAETLGTYPSIPDSICLSHAHLGHVDGLGLLGKEVMSTTDVVIHCSQSVAMYIENTPAYAALIEQGSISISVWESNALFTPTSECGFSIQPIPVPHRSEFSDCHGLIIESNGNRLLFLPDHDSWEETLQQQSIRDWLTQLQIDVALLDGTFWSANELQHRDINEIPHPTVQESLRRLGDKKKGDPDIRFFHLNHTNPLCNPQSKQTQIVREMGWAVAQEGDSFTLESL